MFHLCVSPTAVCNRPVWLYNVETVVWTVMLLLSTVEFKAQPKMGYLFDLYLTCNIHLCYFHFTPVFRAIFQIKYLWEDVNCDHKCLPFNFKILFMFGQCDSSRI